MKQRHHDPRHLDVAAFASSAGHLEGSWALAEMQRVFAAVPVAARDAVMEVRWAIEGECRKAIGAEPQTWLHLEAAGTVWLECQRCLQPVAVALDVRRSFCFVRGEEAAAQLDAELEDDVLELSRSMDLRDLVEDELLLALPIVPRHDHCTHAAPMADVQDDTDRAPNPFAKLASLKRGSSS